MRNGLTVLVLVSSLILAGCVGSGTGTQTSSNLTQGTADAGGATDGAVADVGNLKGIVTDDELQPLRNATVGIPKSKVEVVTDVGGNYAILNLAPGVYEVYVQRLGFDSRAMSVTILAGQTTDLNVRLEPLPVDELRHSTDTFVTQFECMMSFGVLITAWVSSCSWPYEAVYLTAHKNGVNLSRYGPFPPDIMENEWRHPVTVTVGVTTLVSEMNWVATGSASQRMQIVNCTPEYDQVLDECERTFARKAGPSPISHHWKLPKDVAPKDGKPYTYSSNIWLDWLFGPQASVALEQKVTLYNTAFYGGAAPEGWTIFQPSGP